MTKQSSPARDESATRRRTRLAGLIIGLAVAAVVVGVVWAARDGSPADVTLRSELVGRDAPPIAVTDAVETYRVVYRIDSYQNGDATTTTQEVIVRRPFDGRITFRADAPPGGDVDTDYRSSQTLFAIATGGAPHDIRFSRPAPAIGDVRLGAVIEELVDAELFQVRERRRALGRECTVYRTGEILQTLSLAAPTDSNWADVCIGADGVLLEEVAVVGGELALRVLAVELEVGVAVPDEQIAVPGRPDPLAAGTTQLAELPLDAAPFAGYWRFPTPPPGFVHRGRYLVREPSVPGDATAPTAEIHVDVYVRGPDALIVQQGPSGSEPLLDEAAARTVELGALARGTVAPGLAGSIVLANPDDDRFVYVLGTMASSELEEMVKELQPAP
jgi:hypothetical protein